MASEVEALLALQEDDAKLNGTCMKEFFRKFAGRTAEMVGSPWMFIISVLIIVLWAATGPMAHYSDTWQLIINTGTTIITFLMVFLIQNTQNRDTAAMQIKLAELIIRLDGADDKLATAEDLSDQDLERLHGEYKQRAEQTLASLHQRRGKAA